MNRIAKKQLWLKSIVKRSFNYWSVFYFLFYISVSAQAQETDERTKFDWLNLSGFINHGIKYDSRQSVTAREGEVYLFPLPIDLDRNGADKNGFGKLQMFNLHSRMRWTVTGPEIKGFKTSGVLAYDFFGTTNANISSARLRHAYINLDNGNFEILLGQTWHPTFVTQCYPEVIAWGAAIPIQPFNRAPQARITYKPNDNLTVLAAFLSQRDFSNSGPNGSSGDYLRNSGKPEMQFSLMNKFGNNFMMGAVAGFKTIVPRLVTDSLIAHKESISSYNVSAFAKYKNARFSLKIHTVYGQNLSNLLMLGGYMVDEIESIENDFRTYKNLQTYSIWGETEYKISEIYIGFFTGLVKSPDSKDIGTLPVYGLGTNIESLLRWSPRIVYKKDKLKVGLELSSTTANYLEHTLNGQIIPSHDVTNHRWILSTTLFF